MTIKTNDIDRLPVELGDRSYEILIGDGLIADAARHIKPVIRSSNAVIVTDENVAPIALAALQTSLDAAEINHNTIILPPGEQTKSFAHLEQVVTNILEMGIDRKTVLIALGGGVIGDLTGVCASMILRGLDFIQVPTTLLAQVDSSVGGKTAINTGQGKNLVGAFYQPRLVLADIGILDNLPTRELLSGYAEVIKYGCIDQPEFFDWLEEHADGIMSGDLKARRHAIYTSCAAKARIVSADETEQGMRALLNFGHTFAHALEAETGYGDKLLHGEAVGIGMIMAMTLSARLGYTQGNDAARLASHLRGLGMATDLNGLDTTGWTAEGLVAHMMKDKKTEDNRLTFILCRGIGQAFITKDVPKEPVTTVLAEFLTAAA